MEIPSSPRSNDLVQLCESRTLPAALASSARMLLDPRALPKTLPWMASVSGGCSTVSLLIWYLRLNYG